MVVIIQGVELEPLVPHLIFNELLLLFRVCLVALGASSCLKAPLDKFYAILNRHNLVGLAVVDVHTRHRWWDA